MPLASLEEMESNDIIVSVDGDRVTKLYREGNGTNVQQYVLCSKLYMLITSSLLMKMNLTHGIVCRRYILYGCSHR